MTESSDLLEKFHQWALEVVAQQFAGFESGIANQSVENTAWIKLNTRRTVSGIKMWDTGDYYCEILTLDKDEPDMAVFEKMHLGRNFSDEFSIFLGRIKELDARK